MQSKQEEPQKKNSITDIQEKEFIIINGLKVQVTKDANGDYFYKNPLGKIVKVDIDQIKTLVQEKTQKYIINSNGKKEQVFYDSNNKPYTKGKNGIFFFNDYIIRINNLSKRIIDLVNSKYSAGG